MQEAAIGNNGKPPEVSLKQLSSHAAGQIARRVCNLTDFLEALGENPLMN
jgi:hypothetical protein